MATTKHDEAAIASAKTNIVKHTVKDSVFTDLFATKKYLLELYITLHPEDAEICEDELIHVTISNIFTDGIYNDLGFMVGDRLIVLVEAQSTWTVNVAIRILIYLAQTYQNHIKETEQNLYGSKRVRIPKPEFYVIYTGERESVPEHLSLSEEFFLGEESAIEVKVRVISQESKDDIIGQYIIFAKVYDEQLKLHGRTKAAISETIRICKDKGVLKEYLDSREKEVVDIMMTLFDQEEVFKVYVKDVVKDAVKEGRQEGRQEGIQEVAKKLLATGHDIPFIMSITGLAEQEIKQLEEVVH